MTLQEVVVERIRGLSDDDQKKVLDFIGTLAAPAQRINPRGLYADLGIHIDRAVIDEARREAWSNFPRPLPTAEEKRADGQ